VSEAETETGCGTGVPQYRVLRHSMLDIMHMLYGFAATYMMGVAQGFPSKDMTKLEDYGFVASRPRGEYHANNQQMAKLLHKAIGLGGKKAAPMVSQPTSCIDVLWHQESTCIVCQITAMCKYFDLASLVYAPVEQCCTCAVASVHAGDQPYMAVTAGKRLHQQHAFTTLASILPGVNLLCLISTPSLVKSKNRSKRTAVRVCADCYGETRLVLHIPSSS